MSERGGTVHTRVGVNLLWLVPGVVGGSEDYITRLLRAFAEHGPRDFEVLLFTLRQFPDAHPDIAARYRTVTAPIDGANKPLRVAAESSWLAREVRRNDITLVHHAGGRVPAISPRPSLVTIHDVQPLDVPQNFSAVKRAFLGRALPRSARRAAAIATPSEFVRRTVIDRLGAAPERCCVVPAPYRPRAEVRLTRETPGVAAVLDGDAPFFVYPAITYPHKNHFVLLEALAVLHRAHPGVKLVLTGGEGSDENAVRGRVAALGLDGAVVRTGRVPRGDLDALIDRAAALVFPSRYEGFGLPVLEAMASGCPVIAADATSLPEVVDAAGTLVAPDDVQGWADAMAAHLGSARDALGATGRERAAAFSAEFAVEALVRAYANALDAGAVRR